MVKLGEHFASDDRSRHSEWLRQQRWFIKARQDNQRRDDIVEKQDDNFAAFAGEVIMATQTRCPHSYAARDVAEMRNLKKGTVEYQAFVCLWNANGKWQTLERIFQQPDRNQKHFPSTVGKFLFDPANRPDLQNQFDQARALLKLYKAKELNAQ